MKNYKKVNLTSSNLSEEKLSELQRILPEAFNENKIDWEKLRTVLGDKIDERIEKFGFTWAGRSNAIKNVLIPSKATLRPAKDESVKFDESKNLFIEGDNLEVLKLLQKAYFEKVKMIYIDPPYNTGGDFVYRDDFTTPLKNYLQQTGQTDGNGNRLQTNRETNGRYHSDWLSMMYPRLKLAWNLLRDDGVIFVSIDDNEVHHLRMIMNEIFGEENFIASLIWQKKYSPQNDATYFSDMHDYILCYAKHKKNNKNDSQGWGRNLLPRTEEQDARYSNPDNDLRGKWKAADFSVKTYSKSYDYPITTPSGRVVSPPKSRCWATSQDNFEKWRADNRIWFGKDGSNVPAVKIFLSEVQAGIVPLTMWFREEVGDNESAKKEVKEIFGYVPFDTPKPTGLIVRMLQLATSNDTNDLVLDFFAGSATMGQAVLEQNRKDTGNRRFILVQLPEKVETGSEAQHNGLENLADVAKERIRKVIKGYGDKPQPIADGFKVFKLAESNYPENQFEFEPEKSEEENKKAFEDYLANAKQIKLIDNTKTIDVVYENIVKEGLSLNSKIAEQKIGNNDVYSVADGERQLLVCLDNKIDEKTVSELTGKEYKDKTFICLDSALDDTAKANLGLNVELKTI